MLQACWASREWSVAQRSRRPHSPCWSRHWQMSWTWGWTAGRWSALCAFHLTQPPSCRSLHSTRGSFRPPSLERKRHLIVTKEENQPVFNTVTLTGWVSHWFSNPCAPFADPLVFVKTGYLLSLFYCKLWAKSEPNEKIFLPIMTNWESGVNDASSVTPLLLL